MTNFVQQQFATRVLRASTTLTLIAFVVAVLASVASPLASAQTFMFNRADFVTGTGPAVVAVGDFRGNGLIDVVTGNNDTANTVSVLLGKGDGTFAAHVDYAVGAAPSGIAVGDFNGDGKLDIVVVYGFNDARVAVLLGNGDGTFQEPFKSTVAGFQGGSIAVGDFNGDGKLDVAVSDSELAASGVDIMLGNGDGTFKAPVTYATAADPSDGDRGRLQWRREAGPGDGQRRQRDDLCAARQWQRDISASHGLFHRGRRELHQPRRRRPAR